MLKTFLFALLVLWGLFIAVTAVTNPVWDRGVGQMVGAAAMIVLGIWAASRLWQEHNERA